MHLCVALILALAQDDRKPVPDAAAQKTSEGMVKSVFKDEYAKTARSDRVDLAKKLLEQGQQTEDDYNLRYVLLREARDVGAQAGDLDVAYQAIEDLVKTYRVDSLPMRSGVLNTAGRAARPEEWATFAEKHLSLAEEAVTIDNYDVASQSVQAALAFAKKAKDASLIALAEKKAKRVLDFKGRFEKVRSARDALAKSPDDPAANLALGQFRCGVKNDFETGRPLLAKAKDGPWKIAADRELGDVSSATNQMAAGDAWFDIAEKETGIVRENLRARALRWYVKAQEGLSGISRSKLDKRVGELRADKLKGDYVDCTDPSLFGQTGKSGDPLRLVPGSRPAVRVEMERMPLGEFDGIFVVVQFETLGNLSFSVIVEKGNRGFSIDLDTVEVLTLLASGKKEYDVESREKVEKKKEYTMTVLLCDGEYFVFVDHALKGRMKSGEASIGWLALQADLGNITFSKIRLRRKD